MPADATLCADHPFLGGTPWRRALLIAALLLAEVAVRADAPADAHVQALLSVPVEELDHRELDMMTVEYPPGGSSKPHRHDAYVLVYVLRGALDMQVTGQPLVHLAPGQTFVERPSDEHEVSRNASQTEPAKFLVVMLKKAPQAAPP
jgi:quercetin dioxygenase-like cupin family protein